MWGFRVLEPQPTSFLLLRLAYSTREMKAKQEPPNAPPWAERVRLRLCHLRASGSAWRYLKAHGT